MVLHETGMSVQTWPIADEAEYKTVQDNFEKWRCMKNCIAVFWYINGELHTAAADLSRRDS